MKYEVSYDTCKFLAEMEEYDWAVILLEIPFEEEDITIHDKLVLFDLKVHAEKVCRGLLWDEEDRQLKNPLRMWLDTFLEKHSNLLDIPKIRSLYIRITHTHLFAGINAINPQKAYQRICEIADELFSSEEKKTIHEICQAAQKTGDMHTLEIADTIWDQLKGRNI